MPCTKCQTATVQELAKNVVDQFVKCTLCKMSAQIAEECCGAT
jgi:hypothetical protein